MATDIIKMCRGDSFEIETFIPRKDDPSKPYFLTANDVLYLFSDLGVLDIVFGDVSGVEFPSIIFCIQAPFLCICI